MICSRYLRRASALSSRAAQIPLRSPAPALALRPFSSTVAQRSSSPVPEPPSSSAGESPVFGTPLGDSASEGTPAISSCPEGTVLTGLNYIKGRTDPIALPDSAYPSWLWDTLSVQHKKTDTEADDEAGDEFSKSKNQRRLAAKRQRALEARLLAEGNLEALAPKIPLQHQSINLPANEQGTTAGAIEAQKAREELRQAMRKERKAKIKESNYLKSM